MPHVGEMMDHRLVQTPELLPGCCFLSGTNEGPFLDTMLDIEDLNPIGRVYLAVSTISDLAQFLGFVPPEAARRGQQRIADLEAALDDVTQLNRGLQAANESLIAAGYVAPVPVTESALHVPAGSIEDVLAWVCAPETLVEAQARAHAAWNAEMLEERPREALIADLRDFITPKENDAPVSG